MQVSENASRARSDLASFASQSREDVKQVVENAYRSCTVLIRTRQEDINAWTHTFDTLQDVSNNPETDRLWEQLRQQILSDLPEINLDECVKPLDD